MQYEARIKPSQGPRGETHMVSQRHSRKMSSHPPGARRVIGPSTFSWLQTPCSGAATELAG